MNKILIKQYLSPAGPLILGECKGRLCLCDWDIDGRRDKMQRRLCRMLDATYQPGNSTIIDSATALLDEYFAGRCRAFGLPLLMIGTEFQRRIWDALFDIPFGTTITYGDFARRLGMPEAVRAVASAVGANAISIIVSCHRVTGAGGRMGGYAGGLAAKRMLLDHEALTLQASV